MCAAGVSVENMRNTLWALVGLWPCTLSVTPSDLSLVVRACHAMPCHDAANGHLSFALHHVLQGVKAKGTTQAM